MYLPILYLPTVELHCKLHEKLHRVTGALELISFGAREYLEGAFKLNAEK